MGLKMEKTESVRIDRTLLGKVKKVADKNDRSTRAQIERFILLGLKTGKE